MSRITLKQAVKVSGKSESTIRRDMRKGKVSFEKDDRGRVSFDTAELTRAYGQLKSLDSPSDTANDRAMTANDTHVDSPKVTTLLENQIQDLKAQLEKAEQRENTLIRERSKLLDLLFAEKEEKRALMPPPAQNGRQGWWQRLVGK